MKNPLNICNKKILIVAEIGNNHEGNFNTAKKLIKKAAECKVDAVKFQTFIPNLFYSISDKKKLKRLEKFKFSFQQFKKLAEIAKKKNLIFFSTPFDLVSAANLNKIQNVFKISSSDNNFFELIDLVSSYGKDLIVSTGYADLKLVKQIQKRVFNIWRKKKIKSNLAFLHCVSSYPTNFDESNIFTIKTLKQKIKKSIIGYSDHTKGIEACLLSVAMGSRIIEKHFTLDKNFSSFRDHNLSADPLEMTELVKKIRSLEKMINNPLKLPQISEMKSYKFNRRSCAVSKNLKKGDILRKEDIIGVRPLDGISITKKKKIINKKLKVNKTKGSIIKVEDLN